MTGIHNIIFFTNETVDVHNVSMIPSDNPLTLIEGVTREIRCVVNRNAVPVATFTWYVGSEDITSSVGTDAAFINITGKKVDNAKLLQCRASNNNKAPKSSSTMLNVECNKNEIFTVGNKL